MTNLKQQLYYELKRDVPYTKELEERLMNNRPHKKNKLPLFAASFVAAAAAILLFFLQFNSMDEVLTLAKQPKNVLVSEENVPTDFNEIVEVLKQNETVLPFKVKPDKNEVVYDINKIFAAYSGKNFQLSELDVFVATDVTIDKGNYVLYESEGYLYVRQVLAFEGETYRKRQGELYVDGKKVMLPGVLNDRSYQPEQSTHNDIWYFDLIQQADKTMTDDTLIQEGEILVYSTEKKVETISLESIIGKVTAVQAEKPTFMLNGKEAEIGKQFKQTKNIELLKQLEPLAVAQLYVQGLYERDFEMLYAMLPKTIQDESLSLEQFISNYIGETELITNQEAVKAIIASAYNGLENGEVKFGMFNENYATIFYNGNKKEYGTNLPSTISLFKNEQGFWELENPLIGVIY